MSEMVERVALAVVVELYQEEADKALWGERVARAAIAAVREQLAKENSGFLECQECAAHLDFDAALK